MHTAALSRLATAPQSHTKHDPRRCHRSTWGHHVCPQVHRPAFAEGTVATAPENGQKLTKRTAPVSPVQHYPHAAYATLASQHDYATRCRSRSMAMTDVLH